MKHKKKIARLEARRKAFKEQGGHKRPGSLKK